MGWEAYVQKQAEQDSSTLVECSFSWRPWETNDLPAPWHHLETAKGGDRRNFPGRKLNSELPVYSNNAELIWESIISERTGSPLTGMFNSMAEYPHSSFGINRNSRARWDQLQVDNNSFCLTVVCQFLLHNLVCHNDRIFHPIITFLKGILGHI